MAFREVRVFDPFGRSAAVAAGEGIRATERLVGFGRKTVHRYVDAAVGLGLVRDGGEEQLSDVFIGLVVEAVPPDRTNGHGEAWRRLQANHDQIAAWVKDDLTAVRSTSCWPGVGSRSRAGRYSATWPISWAAPGVEARRCG